VRWALSFTFHRLLSLYFWITYVASVCLSVCLYINGQWSLMLITGVSCLKSSLCGATVGNLVYSPRGTSSYFAWRRGSVTVFSRKPAISDTEQDRTTVQLSTWRICAFGWSLTEVKDLEWPWRVVMHFITLYISYEANYENLREDEPILSAASAAKMQMYTLRHNLIIAASRGLRAIARLSYSTVVTVIHVHACLINLQCLWIVIHR